MWPLDIYLPDLFLTVAFNHLDIFQVWLVDKFYFSFGGNSPMVENNKQTNKQTGCFPGSPICPKDYYKKILYTCYCGCCRSWLNLTPYLKPRPAG